MPKKLVWDQTGERLYETGVKNAVIYVYDTDTKAYGKGVAWSGISGVTESPSGAEATKIYADDMKYLNMYSAEELGGTIEAYMYPTEFELCDGSAEIATGVVAGQQARKMFGMTYRTAVGNDAEGNDHGYKLHILYGCRVSPSERAYKTINDSPEAISFSWTLTTTPETFTLNGKETSTSIITIDSTKVDPTKLANLEKILYGSDEADAKLPTPTEIVTMFNTAG